MQAPVYTLPDTNVPILGPIETLDFFHQGSVQLSSKITPLEAWRIIMSQPMPVLNLAFRIRDAVCSLFGVQKIGGFSGTVPQTVVAGQKLDFFMVEHISSDALVLTGRDRHLDVMTSIVTQGQMLTITSSVKVHNRFGWLYMIPVAPAHKLIVRQNLRQLKRELSS
ncbi:DUF2867 domain-containing protein [Flexibacterium corallicola]|uniref:DUF2867 domain-containing protein n=1 Tax=Flexibacterium corallicola TaxID=3037259 RepID=UPI00286ED378|nr:DUF2867 domain-containing protein [Pseudovibrio sp. M1P-2-3]